MPERTSLSTLNVVHRRHSKSVLVSVIVSRLPHCLTLDWYPLFRRARAISSGVLERIVDRSGRFKVRSEVVYHCGTSSHTIAMQPVRVGLN